VATKCEICGKTKSFGHNVSFSKRRTNRDFKPNVQQKRIVINGRLQRVNICTRCIRTAMKAGRMA
jgi:large subunit ribosomal protein L28